MLSFTTKMSNFSKVNRCELGSFMSPPLGGGSKPQSRLKSEQCFMIDDITFVLSKVLISTSTIH